MSIRVIRGDACIGPNMIDSGLGVVRAQATPPSEIPTTFTGFVMTRVNNVAA